MWHDLPILPHLDDRQFLLAVRRLADSLSYGVDPSPFLGAGVDYAQSRLYVPGDPVKSIDWRVTARTGRVHVKEYEAPKRMPVWLVIDTSASMCVGSARVTKYAWAVQLAGALALAAVARMSPVGVLGVGQREILATPSLSRQQVMRWLLQLRRFRVNESTTLADRVSELLPAVSARCLLLVLSDLHDAGSIDVLKLAAQKHDCVTLRLEDPAERGRLAFGLVRGAEAETDYSFTAGSRASFVQHDEINQALRRGGVDHLTLRLDEPFVPYLRAYLRKRDCFGRAAR